MITKKALVKKTIAVMETHGWCRNRNAQDKNGYSTHPTNKHAVSFCAYGAMIKAGGRNANIKCPIHEVLKELKVEAGENFINYNDHTAKRKRDVIGVLKRYLKRLED